MSKEKEVKTDSEKLLLLANWFDVFDSKEHKEKVDDVQKDLRRIAKLLEPVEAEQGEKPDFEKLMDDINYDDNSSPGGFGEECMEKVWNTYVVPLQAELSAVKKSNTLLVSGSKIIEDANDKLRSEVSRLTKERDELKKQLAEHKDK